MDPLASFGWRGAIPEEEDDVVPMVLEPPAPLISSVPSSFRPSFSGGSVLPRDSRWVTIFGVSGGAQALVKTQIEQLLHTEISQVRYGGTNFFHARFPTVADARAAMQLNGHVMEGDLIIGVTTCVFQDDHISDNNQLPTRRTLVPPPEMSTVQSSPLFEPLWNLLDKVFQY
jgi:hypothetical protein